MKNFIFGCLCFFIRFESVAQVTVGTTTSSQYIEGARLVIDILQLFKKSGVIKSPTRVQRVGNFCNFCLYNSDTSQKIKVTLMEKNTSISESIILVIKSNQKECSLQIQCGIYNCKIEGLDEKVISWGDIYINEKEISISK